MITDSGHGVIKDRIKNLSVDESKHNVWPWYLLCLTMPLTEVRFFANIRPYEVVVVGLFFYVLTLRPDKRFRQLTHLDYVVIVYSLYQLLSVMVGAESIYESARAYRYLVLGPVLLYTVIRMSPFSIEIITKAHVVLVLVILIQSLIVFYIFYETGRRPNGMPHFLVGILSKYAFTVSYITVYLLYLRKRFSKGMPHFLILFGLVIAVAGLVGVASRGVTAPTILMLLLVPVLWKSRVKRKIFSMGASIAVIFLVILIALFPPNLKYDQDETLDDRRSLERIVSVQDYIMDLGGRISFWAKIFDVAMNKPVLGHGAATFEISQARDYEATNRGHKPTHSHNVLISSVLTGGLFGLVIMLMLLFAMLALIPKYRARGGGEETFEKALIVWPVVLLVVAITNDITGGLVIPFFFMLGLMQQVQLYGEYLDNNEAKQSDSVTDTEVFVSENAAHEKRRGYPILHRRSVE